MPGSAAPNGNVGPSRTTCAKAKTRATEEELEDGEYEEALALNLRHPAVAVLTIKVCNWKEVNYLDLSKGNYMVWQRRMKMELGMSVPHVEKYLEETIEAPDPLLQPCALRNLQWNSYSIASCMKFRCSEIEQELIEDLMTASEVWAFLKKRHIKRGTMHCVLLKDEFLAMHMDTDPNSDLLGS
ncbi:hypothetical protein BDN71DRAFT_1513215 [Pleurotus eryngii]|uniref:Uncharacterized protein n=1 Tax=Pleurotus eryngii TaxID=5323 RepID=A0A9P6DA37_PLEER|nr:hypothetical protein BDN71DRAFT_1513215 [Pleurotus eryngii]